MQALKSMYLLVSDSVCAAVQVFARISALRDAYDGPQFDDQGLVNTDPRTIAVSLLAKPVAENNNCL